MTQIEFWLQLIFFLSKLTWLKNQYHFSGKKSSFDKLLNFWEILHNSDYFCIPVNTLTVLLQSWKWIFCMQFQKCFDPIVGALHQDYWSQLNDKMHQNIAFTKDRTLNEHNSRGWIYFVTIDQCFKWANLQLFLFPVQKIKQYISKNFYFILKFFVLIKYIFENINHDLYRNILNKKLWKNGNLK